MAVLYTNTFIEELSGNAAADPDFDPDLSLLKAIAIPFDDYAAGTITLTISGLTKKSVDSPGGFNRTLRARISDDGAATTTDIVGDILPSIFGCEAPADLSYGAFDFHDDFTEGGSGDDAFIEFENPLVPMTIYISVERDTLAFTAPTGYLKNYTVTLTGAAGGGGGGGSGVDKINPFNFERGVTQWRTQPRLASTFEGDYVFTLGYDGEAPNLEELLIGDYIQVAQSVTVTGVGVVRAKVRIKQPKSMPDRRDVSHDIQFVEESVDSPGNKIIIPEGVDESDVGRFVTVTGCTNVGNNTTFKIVGIVDEITAYVDQVVVTEGPNNASIVAIEEGARWKLSLLVDDGVDVVERARVVQDPDESGFYRSDLTINVSKMTGAQNIYFRMTLIAHNPDNFYPMA